MIKCYQEVHGSMSVYGIWANDLGNSSLRRC